MSDFLKNRQQDIADAGLDATGEMAETIGLFRDAMHHVAERETARPMNLQLGQEWLVPARKRQQRAHRRMVLAWTCAAALCFAVVPRAMHGPVIHPPEQPKVALTDAALMEHVDSEISETVPDSLAPLTELDSLDSTSSNTATEKKNVTR